MILIDTCVLIRLAADMPLPDDLRRALEHEPWAISCLSAWEIAIKHPLGKLPLPQPPALWWARAVEVFGLTVLDFTDAIALRAGALPPLHADPFDRGIIATAQTHAYRLATVDKALVPYGPACGIAVIGCA
jgi:PIN domain nuclease of toxin-antitoxin system